MRKRAAGEARHIPTRTIARVRSVCPYRSRLSSVGPAVTTDGDVLDHDRQPSRNCRPDPRVRACQYGWNGGDGGDQVQVGFPSSRIVASLALSSAHAVSSESRFGLIGQPMAASRLAPSMIATRSAAG